MKLRIRGDSIRLRLTRGEVERFATEGVVRESLNLGPGGQRFTYAIKIRREAGELSAEMDGGALTVSMPESLARDWAGSEAVGIENPDGSVPRILVEKDFACLAVRPGEDESDMYPNPTFL